MGAPRHLKAKDAELMKQLEEQDQQEDQVETPDPVAETPVEPVIPEVEEVQSPDSQGINIEIPGETATEAPLQQREEGTTAEDRISKLEKAYETLQGKYNAEVPRLYRENKTLRENNNFLQEEINASRKGVNQPVLQERADDRPSSKSDPLKYVSPEEVEEYGEDYVRFQGKIADGLVSEKVGELNKTISEMNRRSYVSEVLRSIPDYDTINNSPDFNDMLDKPDGFSGYSIRERLHEANRMNDADTVISIFNSFRSQPVKPSGIQPIAKERLVVPSKTGAGVQKGNQGAANKKMYTISEIADLHTNLKKGRYSPEERIKIEKEINTAYTEGRIRE